MSCEDFSVDVAPRYVVTAMNSGLKLRSMMAFRDETEEPETVAAWAAKTYPNACIAVHDRYTLETIVYRPFPA